MPSTAEQAAPATGAISYDRVGEGPPLILLHPLGLDRRVWEPVIGLLSAECDVIVPDMPGFGASAALAGPDAPSPAALAAAIGRFADQLDLGGLPDIAGNSLGGWVGLELAAAGRAASVTALAPAGLWSRPLAPKPSTGHRAVKRIRRALPAILRSPRLRRAILSAAVADPSKLSAEAALSIIGAYASGPGFVAVNNAMRAGHFTAWDRIDVPVTVAWAELDRVVSAPRRMPEKPRTITLPGCGHLPMWDDPDLVARVILETSSR